MLRIGLTGGIGAGKSTVADLLAAHGAEIIDADAIAREVVAPGEPLLDVLAGEFGPAILAADGSLDRARLAAVAFADAESTKRLGELMHPVIRDRTAARFAASDAEVVVHDVPLLVENHMEVGYHLTLLVDVPAAVRLARLVETRGMDRADAESRIARQTTDEARRAACDVLIDNTGTIAETAAVVDALWTQRLEPFAENLAAGRPAARAEASRRRHAVGADEHRAGDADRLVAKLRHGTGEAHPISARETPPGAPLSLVLDAGDGPTAEALSPQLTALGFPPAESAGDIGRRASADPGQPADLLVEATE
ncbi:MULTISPECIES: dephospho-CoA kinase [unclassified Brevibacterium]|uniref:dephospho-CoA kinase n=1 Tax=unclassified Brevibacterium TaxID=2614124 RepID=UPI0010F4E33F|nr:MULTISPECIES: dephospho-CoA kinase [unclassified Brevibacterium]MCM1012498.1 dephospho-CoA kinase [Brevibacterium sp. XM4083]